MALPDFTMRQLLEAGAHFGHQSHRWNPKMAPFIYGTRNSIHIIDLAQTVPLLHQALKTVSDTVAKGGRVLFVGTKRQASDEIAAAARRSAQYFVNARWLGGMLTNWKTISGSISRLRKLDEMLAEGAKGLTTAVLRHLALLVDVLRCDAHQRVLREGREGVVGLVGEDIAVGEEEDAWPARWAAALRFHGCGTASRRSGRR